jgi:hypothetical protein
MITKGFGIISLEQSEKELVGKKKNLTQKT